MITPRMMKREEAARYCGTSIAAFEREINAGRFPCPVTIGGRERWCKNALDKALDSVTCSDQVPDYRKRFHERIGKKAA